MIIEHDISKDISLTNVFNDIENNQIIFNKLKESISLQFNFENLNFNYLKEYDSPPFEIYDWLLTYFNETYFVFEDLISIYEQVDRIRFLATVIYEFLFIDIFTILPKVNTSNDVRNELISLLSDLIKSLLQMKSIINDDNVNIDYEILKYTTIIDLLDSDLENFVNNYWTFIIDKHKH